MTCRWKSVCHVPQHVADSIASSRKAGLSSTRCARLICSGRRLILRGIVWWTRPSRWPTFRLPLIHCCRSCWSCDVAEAYPWQASLWQQMAGRAQHAHAYLLHGPAGIGKRALAERLMASLLCKAPEALEACGHCKSCLLLAAGSHPDNYVLEPEEADKPIKVDQVRDLVSFVVQTAQMGG
ncbi:DNA polymerase III subunit delta, partial [Pseudomonas savastanoi pv. glycinea]